jgi:hypothetical protein
MKSLHTRLDRVEELLGDGTERIVFVCVDIPGKPDRILLADGTWHEVPDGRAVAREAAAQPP